MVAKMMKWSPWPAVSKKMEARIRVQKLEGVKMEEKGGFWVEMKLRGENKKIGLRNLRRSFKRRNNDTEEVGGVFQLNQEYKTVCDFSGSNPLEILFTVFAGLDQENRNTCLLGTASLNLSEFASAPIEKQLKMSLPLKIPGNIPENTPTLCLCLGLMELGTVQESVSRAIHPVPSSPSFDEAFSPSRKDGRSSLKAGLQKVRLFRRTTKAFREDSESNSPFDTDSLDDDAGSSSEGSTKDSNAPISYETLAYANFARGSLYFNTIGDAGDEDLIYYNNRKREMTVYPTANIDEKPLKESSKQRILAWRQKKLSFRSSKPKVKGEPLLKKDYGESGGDDIDFDRRQLSSSDESSSGWSKLEDGSTVSRSSFSEFGDDYFAVGSWEKREVVSRDGHMKLQAHVFFASIDQRHERASGESACTALVAVIANWLQSNKYEIPIKSEFDGLIRDGSLEWRKLCENEDYRVQFPNKHFDLDTVIEAEIRPLSVVPEKSFVGFFHPEGLEGDFEFLNGAMSFDSIWEEISQIESELCNGEPLVFIVSWNDHFFVLRVEADACYIIDTLGERLYEGCNQAYILKFDKDTTISKLKEGPKESSKRKTELKKGKSVAKEEELVCKGKESCKEYIKSFLAAIPIRQMQSDMKKGLMAESTPIHHRLQIEFHYTEVTRSES